MDTATKKQILRQMKEQKEQEYCSLTVEIKIAEELGNERKVDQLFDRAADYKKAIKVIEKQLEEMGEENDEG